MSEVVAPDSRVQCFTDNVCSTDLCNGDREGPETEGEHKQGYERDDDSGSIQGFCFIRLWVTNLQHHGQQHRVEKSAWARVPAPTQDREGRDDNEGRTSEVPMHPSS